MKLIPGKREHSKNAATAQFKDKDFERAAGLYTKSLGPCRKLMSFHMMLSIYLDLTWCFYNLELLNEVIMNCRDALSLNPSNAKTLERRAYAFIKL